MPDIGIITNPYSKLNKRNPSRTALLGYILGKKGVMEITQSLEHLAMVTRKFCEQDVSIVAINGGDGTISHTLTALVDAYGDKPLPKIALLRGGTMNVLAGHLGITGQPEKLLYLLLQGQSLDGELPVTTLRSLVVNKHHGFIYADGSITRLLEEYYLNKSGTITAGILFVKIAASFFVDGELFRRLLAPNTITLSEGPRKGLPHDSLALFVSSISNLPLGVPLLKSGPQDLNNFQAVSISCPVKGLFWKLPSIVMPSQAGEHPNKLKFFCPHLIVSSASPSRYTLDGEIYEPQGNATEISMGPCIQFINI